MLKKISILMLLTLTLQAKDSLLIGAGFYAQTQPYKDAEPVVQLSPVLFYDNSLLYVRWTRIGMYVAGEQRDKFSWGISLTAQPQILGYYQSRSLTQINSSDKTTILSGMRERKSGWEAGVAIAAKYNNFFAESVALQDISNESNGLKLRAEIGYSYKSEKIMIVPSLLAVWLSQPMSNYYFGVEEYESDLSIGRSEYRSSAAVNTAAQTYFKYSFNKKYHALFNIRADYLAQTIQDSPLVDKRFIFSGLISLMYNYEL